MPDRTTEIQDPLPEPAPGQAEGTLHRFGRFHARTRTSPLALALEPRFMFDAAGVATGGEAAVDAAAQAAADQQTDNPPSDDAADPLADALSATAPPADRKEVVFVDPNIQNVEALLSGVHPAADVVVLDPAGDGLAQIADYLADRTDIDAVHIVSHGQEGGVRLGGMVLDLARVESRGGELATIGAALAPEADILIYGCDVGANDAGRAFITALADATGADVAASSDDTGATEAGGDWDLEVATGDIEATLAVDAAARAAFQGRLDSFTVTTATDEDDGGGATTSVTLAASVTPVNDPPTLSDFGPTLAATEQVTTLIDADVTFDDPEDDFDGSVLSVSGLAAGDVVSVLNTGNGAGQIGFDAGTGAVRFGGIVIGTLTGGAGSAATITFNASATNAAVEALIESLTFTATADDPAAARELTIDFTDVDGAGLVVNGTPIHVAAPGAASPLDGLDVGSESRPAFVDIDNDGDLDAFVGNSAGKIDFFRNEGSRTSPDFVAVVGAENPFDGVGLGFDAAPTFADIDGDGDFDAFVGVGSGQIAFFRNEGTVDDPSFSGGIGQGPLARLDVGNNSMPFLADIDNDGDLDVFVGEADGNINFLLNDGDRTAPFFVSLVPAGNPLNNVDIGSNSAPVLVDVDNDGDLDAFVGTSFGEIRFFRNDGDPAAANFVAATGADNPLDGFDVGLFAAPSFADLTGDGDPDAVVGNSAGVLTTFQAVRSNQVFVTVTAVNDNPAVTGLPTDVAVTEDIASDIDLSAATFTDPDSGDAPITLSVAAGTGTLTAASGSGVTIGGSGTGTVALTGTAADIDAFLNTPSNIQYTSAANANGDDADTLTLTANDGGNTGTGGGGDVALGTVNVDITAINDDPTLVGLPASVTVVEDTASPVDLSAATLADVDSGAAPITLTIGAGTGTLAAPPGGGVTVILLERLGL